MSDDAAAKRIEQFLSAASAKPSGYEEFVGELQEAQRLAHEKHIPDR